MSEMRGKTIRRGFWLLLAILFGSLFWLTVRVVQRDRASRALIVAIKHNDARAVLAALAWGADPNAREQLSSHRSFWQRVLDEMLGRRRAQGVGPSALVLAVRRDLASSPPEQGRSLAILQALIKSGASVPSDPPKATSSLQWAARRLGKIPTGPPLVANSGEADDVTNIRYTLLSAKLALESAKSASFVRLGGQIGYLSEHFAEFKRALSLYIGAEDTWMPTYSGNFSGK